MPKFTASIAFSGQYKPAHFEGLDMDDAVNKLLCAMIDMPEEVIQQAIHIRSSFTSTRRYSSVCSSYGGTHVTVREGEHDPWLATVTADMPHHPGLDYSEAA